MSGPSPGDSHDPACGGFENGLSPNPLPRSS